MGALWKLLCCLLGGAAFTAAGSSQPSLPIGECVVKVPISADTQESTSFTIRCQLAALGVYLPKERSSLKVVLAPEINSLACSPLEDGLPRSSFEGAVVIVRRGECSFQEKLAHVADAGAAVMVLVNSDDTLIPLSSLEYDRSTAAAVSVPKSDGERLVALVKGTTAQVDEVAGVEITMTSPMDLVSQARARLQFLVDINTPLAIYEEYWDVAEQLQPVVGTLDELLEEILSENFDLCEKLQDATKSKNLVDFLSWSAKQLSKWDFATQASLHASVAAAVLQIQTMTDHTSKDRLLLQPAANRLMEAGYYAHSAILLQRILAFPGSRPVGAARCQLAFVKFLQGNLSAILFEARECRASKFDISIPTLEVAKKAFLRLTKFKISTHDRKCVEVAARSVNDTNLALSCCHLAMEPTGSLSRKFSSEFTEELFHSLVLLGVFMDELGPFSESMHFFSYAARLCDGDRTTLELRQHLAVPVLFSTQAEMYKFVGELKRKLKVLTEAAATRAVEERVISPHGDTDKPAEVASDTPSVRKPEAAAYLQYTITPSTMFIGYQGVNVLPIQRAINQLRLSLYPSLLSSFDHQSDALDESLSAGGHQLRQIGFISTWFRVHSVGKLLLGIVENLDRTKFHVTIYRCVHFLSDSDDITEGFKKAADEYVELPESQDAAVQIIREAHLDIAIFPELGMDEWTVLLSHHRVAPIQCVFWGHPITTGNPNIDYFISSEHFVSESFDDSVKRENELDEGQLNLSGYRRSLFSEKIVLFRGLSTIFTEPKPLTAESRGITRSRLYLPANRRLYVCPQTLMKMHPAFDEALTGILEQDDKAAIVLLASETQTVWMEQLRRRFRQRFGRNHRRVLVLPTLPFPEFQALLTLADVLLDPFPFGGGVTTLDALHLGIPVVTLPSAQSVVHLAAGFLRYMNASDCIASSLDEYVGLAIQIAKDHEDIRQRLLAHRSDIYQDVSTVEDWNSFLATATPVEQDATS